MGFYIVLTNVALLIALIESKQEITIFAISTLDDNIGKSVVGAQWLGIEEINNDHNFFPNYSFNLQVFNCRRDHEQALLHALNVTTHTNTPNNTYLPIILGAPWSSLSTAIAPLLGAFNIGQMSVATSITLSQTNKYPYFYRTIPSDALQAEGIILLCNTFNWTSIAVVYVNDAYGLYLSIGLQASAKKTNIHVTSIAISEYEDVTFIHAAEQIKELNIYIIVIIIHANYLTALFNVFQKQDMLQYPYLFLGTDGWFDRKTIQSYGLQNVTAGFIGTVPWQTQSLLLNEYTDDIQGDINQSIVKYKNFQNLWDFRYKNGGADNLYLEQPGIFVIYGYDNLYTLFNAFKYIEDNSDLFGGNLLDLLHLEDSNKIISILNSALLNETNFIGLSGRILFNKFGDRIHGLYSFGNILTDGSIDYFGYLYQNDNGTINSTLNKNKIKWPEYFTSKGMIPRTNILVHQKIINVPTVVTIVILAVSTFSIFIAFSCIVASIYYRNNRIIRASSWRLNIILCIGAILAYIRIMLYGIDESLLENHPNQQKILDILCNLRVWLVTISYTLLFMPLFAKTYRLSQIFNTILIDRNISDRKLFMLIGSCVLIDIILLTILTAIHPLKRFQLKANVEIIDDIQQIQYIYGSCAFHKLYFNEVYFYFYGLITGWKLCESSWGIMVALSVSRVHFNGPLSKQLIQFDETGSQLFSILFTAVVILITIPIFVFGILTKNILIYYLTVAIATIVIVNIVVWINLFPRIFAVIKKNEDKFKKSPAEQMESKIKKQLFRLGNEKSWWHKKICKPSIDFSTDQIDKYPSVGGSIRTGTKFIPLSVEDDDVDTIDDSDTLQKMWSAEVAALHVE